MTRQIRYFSFPMKWLLAIGLWVGWGITKIPIENQISLTAPSFQNKSIPFTLSIRDQIGQNAALALLSGFRGFVADCLWLKAQALWEQKKWFQMRQLLELVCTLQPRSILFWEIAAWHMAWNLSEDALHDPSEPRAAVRYKAYQDWILAGQHLLERGLANMPDRYNLWFQLGWLMDQRLHNYDKAIEYYRKAAEFANAPLVIHRLIGFRLEAAGRKRQAYEYWRNLWQSHPDKSKTPLMLWNRIEKQIQKLEEELQIPNEQKLFLSR